MNGFLIHVVHADLGLYPNQSSSSIRWIVPIIVFN
jgi:hypothetical protein